MTNTSRHVFYVSDGTGLTAEMLGETLITQFQEIEFKRTIFPYIKNDADIKKVVKEIKIIKEKTDQYPLVISTLVDDNLRKTIAQSGAVIFDLFATFIEPLEKLLNSQSIHKKGRMHGIADKQRYHHRVSALNYSLNHDDGLSHQSLEKADVIILGVSRSGKTPTALYMAMQFSLKAANYPLTNEDLDKEKLPDFLQPLKHKLIGLNIKPEQLSRYRQERRLNSKYASLIQCKKEIQQALHIFDTEGISYLDTSSISIEEIATWIMQKINLQRPGY